MLLFSDMVYMLVRYVSPSGPMCLRCLMLTLSGLWSCCFYLFYCHLDFVVVSVMLVVCSLSVFLSMCLFVLSVRVPFRVRVRVRVPVRLRVPVRIPFRVRVRENVCKIRFKACNIIHSLIL